MKILQTIIFILLSMIVYAQNCFTSDSDVINYVLNKTFITKDGKTKTTFGTSSASVTSGSNSFTYIYDNFRYIMNSGYKGIIKMTNTSTTNQMTLFVSCRERMITDGQGTVLYQSGTVTVSTNLTEEEKQANIDSWNRFSAKMDARRDQHNNLIDKRLGSSNDIVLDNNLKSVRIGNRLWATENLTITKFKNGDPIPQCKSKDDWVYYNSNEMPCWCYNYGEEIGKKFGLMYNYYAITDERGLAPEGWVIPSAEDWVALRSYTTNYVEFMDSLLWSATVERSSLERFPGVNKYGFNAKPGGTIYSNNFSQNIPNNHGKKILSGRVSWWGKKINGEVFESLLIDYKDWDLKFFNIAKPTRGMYVRLVKEEKLKGENEYNPTKYGSQEWMNANLTVTTFRNGDSIKECRTESEWINASRKKIPAYCKYNNSDENGFNSGFLYNHYAVLDSRGLAPYGWHIPSESEWKELAVTLRNVNPSIYKLNLQSKMQNGDVGFNSGYAGKRTSHYDDRPARFKNNYIEFWTSTPNSSAIPNTGNSFNFVGAGGSGTGLPVRCIRDSPEKRKKEQRERELQDSLFILNIIEVNEDSVIFETVGEDYTGLSSFEFEIGLLTTGRKFCDSTYKWYKGFPEYITNPKNANANYFTFITAVDNKGGVSLNRYSVPIKLFSKYNTLYVTFQISKDKKRSYKHKRGGSDKFKIEDIDLYCFYLERETPRLLTNLEKKVKDTIEFDGKSWYYIEDTENNYSRSMSGYGNKIDVSQLKRGSYVIRWDDSKTRHFKKK